MPIRTREELIALFETGDKPIAQDFIDLIDSLSDNFQKAIHEVIDSPVTEVVFSGLNSVVDGGYSLLAGIVSNAASCDFNTYFNGQLPVNHRNTKLATSFSTSSGYFSISGITLKSSWNISTPSYILTGGNWEPIGGTIGTYFTLELSSPRSLGRVYLYSDRSTTNRWDILGSNDNVTFTNVGYIQCAAGGVTATIDNPIAYKFYKFYFAGGTGGPYHNGIALYDYSLGNPIVCAEVNTDLTGAAIGVGRAAYANDGSQYESAPQLINPSGITSITIQASIAGGIGIGSKFILLKHRR